MCFVFISSSVIGQSEQILSSDWLKGDKVKGVAPHALCVFCLKSNINVVILQSLEPT